MHFYFSLKTSFVLNGFFCKYQTIEEKVNDKSDAPADLEYTELNYVYTGDPSNQSIW